VRPQIRKLNKWIAEMLESPVSKKRKSERGNYRQAQGWMLQLWFEQPGSDIASGVGLGFVAQILSDHTERPEGRPKGDEERIKRIEREPALM
jgi:hypothetical protein